MYRLSRKRAYDTLFLLFLKLFKPFYVFFLERSLVDTTTPVFYFNAYKRNQRSYNRLILHVNNSVTYDGRD